MVASTASSYIFVALALLVLWVLVVLLLRYYIPLRTTPGYIILPVFLAIALPSTLTLLVPIDLASSAGTDAGGLRGIGLPERVLLKSWRITYWLIFALTWAILPLLGEYNDAGYQEPMDKLKYSLRSNGRYWAMVLSASAVSGTYFIWQNGFNAASMKGLVMALAYAWGLFLATFLMGHGLVALPRRLYRYASITRRLRTIQSHAPKIHDRLVDAIEKLDQYEADLLLLQQRKTGSAINFREWIEELSEAAALPESRASSSGRTSRGNVPTVITERYMADLSRKLKRARHRKMRFVDEWDRLVQSAVKTQAILDSAASKRLELPRDGNAPAWSRFNILTPYTRYLLHYRIAPPAYYTLAAILSMASVVVVWSSIVKSLDTKLSLIGRSIVHHPRSDRGQIGLAGQMIAAFWMLYMCTCALYTITEVKVWGNRALVRRGTYLESACWYSQQVAKLTVPLAYNFITFLPPNIYLNTQFHKFLGKLIVLTRLGDSFQKYFPMLILLPVCFALFGVYGRVRNMFSFGDDVMPEDEDSEDGIATAWREGRILIDREVQTGAAGVTASHGPSSVGLSTRDERLNRYEDEPSDDLLTPGTSSRTTRTTPAGAVRAQRERRSLLASNDDDDDEGGSFFGDFAARVRNTFDNADISFERPAWMGGAGDDGARGRRRAVGRDDSPEDRSNGWMSLFGGGSSQGRVRI